MLSSSEAYPLNDPDLQAPADSFMLLMSEILEGGGWVEFNGSKKRKRDWRLPHVNSRMSSFGRKLKMICIFMD